MNWTNAKKHKGLKLTQENMDRWTNKDLIYNKKLPSKKSTEAGGFTGESCQNFKEKITPIPWNSSNN